MTTVTCPLCPETFEAREVPRAPAIAEALGMGADALQVVHTDQVRRRLEQDLDRHLRTHPPKEWLPALMTARRERDAAHEALAALSLTDYEQHHLDEIRAGG
jgi:hypothetical protein